MPFRPDKISRHPDSLPAGEPAPGEPEDAARQFPKALESLLVPKRQGVDSAVERGEINRDANFDAEHETFGTVRMIAQLIVDPRGETFSCTIEPTGGSVQEHAELRGIKFYGSVMKPDTPGPWAGEDIKKQPSKEQLIQKAVFAALDKMHEGEFAINPEF